MSRRVIALVAVVIVWSSLSPARAEADVQGALKEAWKCAKSVPGSVEAIGKDLVAKGEAVASISASIGTCAATSGGRAELLAFTTATLGTIKSTTDLLPDGQCKSRIHGVVAKPFALGLATILPEGDAKKTLVGLASSKEVGDEVWALVRKTPPPFSTIPDQLDCACDMIEAGVTMADVTVVVNVINNTSKACAGILDEVGLGFLNDWGSAVIGWFGGAYRSIAGAWDGMLGKKEALPDEVVYQGYFGAYGASLASELAIAPPGTAPESLNLTTSAEGGFANLSQYSYAAGAKVTLGYLEKECKSYYASTKRASKHEGKCAGYKTRVIADAQRMAARLRLVGTDPVVFKLKLYGWLTNHALWRLPPCRSWGPGDPYPHTTTDANECDLTAVMAEDRWKLGTFTPAKPWPWEYQATGIYARARQALVDTGYDQDLAHQATLVGAEPGIRARTLDAWKYATLVVRQRWLPPMTTRPPMLATYGCPNGDLSAPCIKAVETSFDSVCFPQIRDAFALAPDPVTASIKLGGVKQSCQQLVTAVVKNATDLDGAGSPTVMAKQGLCPPVTDRAKHGDCMARLTSAWSTCAAAEVGNVLGTPMTSAKRCFENAAIKMGGTAPRPGTGAITPPPGGFKPVTR